MRTLGEVAQIIMGQSPDGSTTSSEKIGLPLLNGPTEFGGHHPSPVQFTSDVRKRAQNNDLLFCVRGSTTGRMNWADQEYAIGRGIAAIRHRKGPKYQPFVRAVVEYGLPSLLVQATGSTFPNVSFAQLSLLPYPDVADEDECAIAHVLGTIDDKIELNHQLNMTLEEMAQTLFRSWFMDFDPVKAKINGREPDGMDDDTAALFPDAFEKSEIGMIPTGWGIMAVSDASEVNPSRRLGKGSVAPYLDMGNMPTQSARALEVFDREFSSGTKFQNGDTLVARITPCLENGKTAYVDFLEAGQVGWGSTEYIILRPRLPLTTEYAYYLARTEEFRTFAISNMTGSSGRQRVPSNCLDNYKIAVPTGEIAAQFGRFASDIIGQMKANDEQSATLNSMRDELLPKLLSGEIRVPTEMLEEFTVTDGNRSPLHPL